MGLRHEIRHLLDLDAGDNSCLDRAPSGRSGRAAGRPHRVDAAANAPCRDPFGKLVKYGYALMVESERLNVRRPM
jgi:hypothetical protein